LRYATLLARLQEKEKEVKKIIIVSYGRKQKETKRVRWLSRYVKRIDCDRLPSLNQLPKGASGFHELAVLYYEHDIRTIAWLTDVYSTMLVWARKRSAKKRTCVIYCRSESGTVRSVYVANKLRTFLASQGIESEVVHMELARQGRLL